MSLDRAEYAMTVTADRPPCQEETPRSRWNPGRKPQDLAVRGTWEPEPGGRVLPRESLGLAAGGRGVGRDVTGRTWFVEGAVPGDLIEAETVRAHARFVEGRAARIDRPGPSRRSAPCPMQGACGGCPWMVLGDAAQRDAKIGLLRDALVHIGRFDRPPLMQFEGPRNRSPTATRSNCRSAVIPTDGASSGCTAPAMPRRSRTSPLVCSSIRGRIACSPPSGSSSSTGRAATTGRSTALRTSGSSCARHWLRAATWWSCAVLPGASRPVPRWPGSSGIAIPRSRDSSA